MIGRSPRLALISGCTTIFGLFTTRPFPTSGLKGQCPRWAYSRRIPAREGRAEPATSVSNATHNQVVSRATRDQADPLAPAGRRFGNFVFGANDRSCGRHGAGRALDFKQ